MHGGTLLWLALHRQQPMVQRHQMAGDAQAKTDASAPAVCPLAAYKRLKDMLLKVYRDTAAAIGDPDMQVRRGHLRPQHDPSACGPCSSVAEEVEQDLPQPHSVGHHQREADGQVELPGH